MSSHLNVVLWLNSLSGIRVKPRRTYVFLQPIFISGDSLVWVYNPTEKLGIASIILVFSKERRKTNRGVIIQRYPLLQ